jgi:hypothetical protein
MAMLVFQCFASAFAGSENDCARFRGHSEKTSGVGEGDLHHARLTYKLLLLRGLLLGLLLGFRHEILQLQVSPGTEYIHALINYKQACMALVMVLDVVDTRRVK